MRCLSTLLGLLFPGQNRNETSIRRLYADLRRGEGGSRLAHARAVPMALKKLREGALRDEAVGKVRYLVITPMGGGTAGRGGRQGAVLVVVVGGALRDEAVGKVLDKWRG